jgi:hypothetical protein
VCVENIRVAANGTSILTQFPWFITDPEIRTSFPEVEFPRMYTVAESVATSKTLNRLGTTTGVQFPEQGSWQM